jgi:antitoxin (DNA-binding transcriptional repressor) of toxin-antitoxin stability system
VAIYVVSLPSLARFREWRARRKEAFPEAAGIEPRSSCAEAGEQVTETRNGVPTATLTPSSREKFGPAEAVENLLSLSKPQVETLLSEQGKLAGKAWLALISRLASIETQLARLIAQGCAGALSAPVVGGADMNHQEVRDTGKSELLERVFRNNLLLRRMG